MCVLIAEIVLFISGLWAMITGKVPALVFGKKYRIEGLSARLIGLILILPLPVTFVAGIILTLLLGQEQAFVYASIVEILTVVICLGSALIVSYRVRKPV